MLITVSLTQSGMLTFPKLERLVVPLVAAVSRKSFDLVLVY